MSPQYSYLVFLKREDFQKFQKSNDADFKLLDNNLNVSDSNVNVMKPELIYLGMVRY